MPPELVSFCETGRSLLVGTCSADGVPDCVRVVGVRVWPDASHVTVLIPQATGADAVANARANPKLALTLSEIPSHRTMQIKGDVLAIREGSEDDRARATAYRSTFAKELGSVGPPIEMVERLGIWPLWAVDVAIRMVFAQTPGPTAGARMPVQVKAL